MSALVHIPVMPSEVMDGLNVKPGAVIVDGTIGLAGHAVLIAQVLGAQGHLIGIDRDPYSLAEAKKLLVPFSSLKIDLWQGSFAEVKRILAEARVKAVDGILLDLGLSSFQLDDPKRGFSFATQGPLDMRMDPSQDISAAHLVNSLKESELARIIATFGQDRLARRIARAIVWHRARQKIETTDQLTDVVLRALPAGYRRGRIHPATRTFQALRITVNRELDTLKEALGNWLEVLNPGGRICVISFHSLEDRIVKNTFKQWAGQGQAHILTKKPLRPSQEECVLNLRARSAKLRVMERIR